MLKVTDGRSTIIAGGRPITVLYSETHPHKMREHNVQMAKAGVEASCFFWSNAVSRRCFVVMKKEFIMRFLRISTLAMMTSAGMALCAEPVTLVFEQPETAGISGFRAFWDLPVPLAEDGVIEDVRHQVGGGLGNLAGPTAFWAPAKRNDGTLPGALVFDAVHRSLLVRFPGSAEVIAEKLADGYRIEKAEIELPFINTELWPEGYSLPSGMSFLRDEWVRIPPNWHAVAWALRKPWTADPELGPTFNAAINGALHWRRFGAQDELEDRYPQRFGPTEVSYRQATDYRGDEPPAPVGNRTPDTEGGTPATMDITPLLTDTAFGDTLAARLRQFEDCGVLIRKWEVYDARYHTGCYEWTTATGRRGILIRTPTLRITLTPDVQAEKVSELPPAADIAKRAADLLETGHGGEPTAVMPDAEQIAEWADKYGFRQPEYMPDWQWQRVRELRAHGGGWNFPRTPEAYARWIDGMLSVPPRQWLGHNTPQKAINALRFGHVLPTPVLEHEKNYFEAWAMPHLPTDAMDHPQAPNLWWDGVNRHWEETRDWRGNHSYYRAGYTRTMSTQNINHLGASGALFGGALVGSEFAIADGRHGLEHYPLRLWAWYDGSTQEAVDHFYLPLTLWTQKSFADFGPDPFDRLMGHSMLAKTMDEIISAYHPGLRRFIAPSGRTGMQEVLVTQTGLQFILHTLSRQGTLRDVGNENTYGMAIMQDSNVSPGYAADQTLHSPWAPEWATYMVDEKPLPYELTATFKQWGHHREFPVWKRSYLGNHYGLTSRDHDFEGAYHFVQAMAQWRREEKPVDRLDEVVVMLVRPAADDRNMDWYGSRQWTDTPPLGGLNHNLQHKNKLIALTSPVNMRDRVAPRTLQTTLAFFNFQDEPTWEIYVDDQPVAELPFRASTGQRITIQDGVSYVGIIPIPATDLGRDAEVVLYPGVPVEMHGIPAQHRRERLPGLLISNYMLRQDQPLEKDATDWEKVQRAHGGFVIEMGDVTEYPDFAAFQAHIAAATFETRWEDEAGIAHIKYVSGDDIIEAGYNPMYSSGSTATLFPYRRVNGEWMYLPPGIDRDSTLSRQGTTGRLEKLGAVLECEPGRMAFLQAEPTTGTFVGYNPLPDPTFWSLSLPGGMKISADGRIGIARIAVQPETGRIRIEHALRDDQATHDTATAIVASGLHKLSAVTLNGADASDRVLQVEIDGEQAHVVPLRDVFDIEGFASRYSAAQQVWREGGETD